MRSTPFVLIVVLAVSNFFFTGCDCTDKCPQEVTQEFTVPKPYRHITAGSNFTFTILPGKEYTMKATGCANDLADMTLNVSDSVLDIRFSRHRSKRYMVDITVTTPGGADVLFFKTPRVVITPQNP